MEYPLIKETHGELLLINQEQQPRQGFAMHVDARQEEAQQQGEEFSAAG